jgi:hypothetical protein
MGGACDADGPGVSQPNLSRDVAGGGRYRFWLGAASHDWTV